MSSADYNLDPDQANKMLGLVFDTLMHSWMNCDNLKKKSAFNKNMQNYSCSMQKSQSGCLIDIKHPDKRA